SARSARGDRGPPRFEPRQRLLLLIQAEMLHLRADEVSDDAWHDRQQLTVGNRGNAPYVSVVLTDELQVRKKTFEVLPAGERLGVDHQARELSVCRNEWINLLRDELEVRFFQWPLGRHDKDAPVTQQFEMDHEALPFG